MGSLFPVVSVALFLGTISILAFAMWSPINDRQGIWGLVLIVGYAVFHRIYTYAYPASLIGVDPDTYAIYIQSLIDGESLNVVTLPFYQDAPLHLLLGSTFGTVAGLDAPAAMAIFPFVVGVILPITAATLTGPDSRWQGVLIAATIAAVTSISFWFSYWPIAQTTSLIYWCVFVIALWGFYQYWSDRYFILILLVAVALIYTHKFPLTVVITVVFVFTVLGLVRRFADHTNYTGLSTLLWVVVLFLFLQAFHITHFIYDLIIWIFSLYTDILGGGRQVGGPIEPTNAVPASTSIGRIGRLGNVITLLLVGFSAWLYMVIWRRESTTYHPSIIVITVTVAIFILFTITDTIDYYRPLLLVEVVLAGLIGSVVAIVDRSALPSRNKTVSIGIVVCLVLLLATQSFATVTTPDSADSPRYYLTDQEVDAKEFGYQYIPKSIGTDDAYASETPPSHIITPTPTDKYQPINAQFVNATLAESKHEYIAYRSDKTMYGVEDGLWHLTWNPLTYLNTSCAKLYDTDDVHVYTDCYPEDRNATDESINPNSSIFDELP